MTSIISKAEHDKLITSGATEEQITEWISTGWTREEILEMIDVDDDHEPISDVPINGIHISKGGAKHCPICNVLQWNKRMNYHIFKEHQKELLLPWNQLHNKDILIQNIVIPLRITTPVFDNDNDKPKNIITQINNEQNENQQNDIQTGHGQADSIVNPKTGRRNLKDRKRPENFNVPELFYCLCCSKAWTSEKPARKHFTNIDGSVNECTSRQLLQLNHLRGKDFAIYNNASINIRLPNLGKWSILNKDVQLKEKDIEIKELKKKLTAHADMGIKKDNEILKLKSIIEKLESQIIDEPFCCKNCMKL